MRRRFSDAIVALAGDPTLAFLTGDLGYMALEPVRDALGTRFLNAGVAEQNMISVAAGLARTGLRPWAYSIAPFLYARPFEQVRNDVCLHRLPVRLVGNGGGYGYGVMGATHHALEDYGALLTLDAMTVLVPAFGADVAPAVTRAHGLSGPSYLRLGLAEEPSGSEVPAFAPWRRVVDGDGPVVLACGPIAGTLLAPLRDRPEAMRPRLWVVSELPFTALPPEFLDDLRDADRLVVVEEHVAHGGVGQAVALALAKVGATPSRVDHRHALGYPSGRYGSQKWHRAECGLDVASLLALVDDTGDGPNPPASLPGTGRGVRRPAASFPSAGDAR